MNMCLQGYLYQVLVFCGCWWVYLAQNLYFYKKRKLNTGNKKSTPTRIICNNYCLQPKPTRTTNNLDGSHCFFPGSLNGKFFVRELINTSDTAICRVTAGVSNLMFQ